MRLTAPVTELKGVGEANAKLLERLGISSILDLIEYFPFRYEDFSKVTPVAQLKPGPVSARVKFEQISGRYARGRRLHITEANGYDETGKVKVAWFNQAYRADNLKPGEEYFLAGNLEFARQRYVISNPTVEAVSDFPTSTARIIPIYRQTKGLRMGLLRRLIKQVAPMVALVDETLPSWLVKDAKLMARADALLAMHFPESEAQLERARHRLGFEEVFELALASLYNRQIVQAEKGFAMEPAVETLKGFTASLPYKLTNAQRRSAWEIIKDMSEHRPMNRLLEGDVGSGKTAVAAMALINGHAAGYQGALMAPTEILATQHAESLHELLAACNISSTLLLGSMTKQQKETAADKIAAGQVDVAIGTHALFQQHVKFKHLGLVIVDEQHRFGVEQRKELQTKAKLTPHVLTMSATPIPRSLALTLYGELDISVIDEMPPGRVPTKTSLFRRAQRREVYRLVEDELAKGHQAFVVAPLIAESNELEVISAEELEKEVAKLLPHRQVGLVHGRLKAAEKQKVMQGFVDGKIDVLVATTVIEVGVNVPNATVMVIEGAERFGLAQLHQLRGRVGRASHQAYCYLVTTEDAVPRRLLELAQINDGFKLAELDLQLRGAGEIYGRAQHGPLDLRVAKLSDGRLIASARRQAQAFIDRGEQIKDYKHLEQRVQRLQTVTNFN